MYKFFGKKTITTTDEDDDYHLHHRSLSEAYYKRILEKMVFND